MAKNSNARIFLSRVEFWPVENNVGYYNLRPVLEFSEQGPVAVESSEFPKYGTINIKDAARRSSSSFVQDGRYYIWRISDSEILGLEQNANGYCIDYDDYLRKVQSVDTFGLCEVLNLATINSYNLLDFSTWGEEAQTLETAPFSRTVYLNDRSHVLGPFSWNERDGKYTFCPAGTGDDNYLLNCYLVEDLEMYNFLERTKNNSVIGHRFLMSEALPAKARQSVDCIGVSKLREIIGNLVAERQGAQSRQERRAILDALNSLPSESLSGKRRERMLQMAKQGDVSAATVAQIAESVFSSEAGKRQVVEAVLGKEEYRRSLYSLAKEEQGYSRVIAQIEAEKNQVIKDLEKQIALKRKEVEAAQHDLKIVRSKSKKLVKKGKKGKEVSVELEACAAEGEAVGVENQLTSAELAKFNEKKRQLDEEIATLQQSVDALQERMRLEEERAKQQREAQYKETRSWQRQILSEQNNVMNQFDERMRQAYASLAFDGPIASAMMQAAAKFEGRRKQAQIQASVHTLSSLQGMDDVSDLQTTRELAEFITTELNERAHRDLSYNDVANLLLCVSQGFLTVLAGQPGTGKSSLVDMMSHIMGLDHPTYPRFQEVAVEKGWTSRRDLIGYYNPLTHAFESANQGMFSCLTTLKAETEQNIADFPYFVLLDEANLSPMEHYWADFMGLCDLTKRGRKVSLGADYNFPVGQTLRFIATINVDQTTEMMSPRLLDRAWIIKMRPLIDDVRDIKDAELAESYPMVPFSLLQSLNDSKQWLSQELDSFVIDRFNEIFDICRDFGLMLSPRVLTMLRRYLLAAKGFIDTSFNGFAALDYATAQKVLPLLDGSGKRHREFLEELLKICDYQSMPLCHSLIDDMLERGQGTMQFYRFLGR